MEISRAEQQPITAEQEQNVVERLTHHGDCSHDHNDDPLYYYPYHNDSSDDELPQLGTTATGTVNTSNSTQQASYSTAAGYYGNDSDNDDFIELSGDQRQSPIFI